MTALGSAGHPLAPGTTPGAIREHLLDEDRPLFDDELRAAQGSGSRDAVVDCIEHWRCVAVVQSDREEFTRVVRRAAARNTGEASPDDEPLSLTRLKAGM